MSETVAAPPKLIRGPWFRDWCHYCLHEWEEHDGMGDCHHPDKRTRTGLCNCTKNTVTARRGSDTTKEES